MEQQTSGLVAPKFAGAGHQLEQEIHKAWDTFDVAELELTKSGFSPMEKPECARPTVSPGRMATMSGPDITTLYETVVAWHGYAANMHARIRGAVLGIQNEKKHLEAKLYKGIVSAAIKMGEKKPSDVAIKRDISIEPRMLELTQEEQKLEQQRFQLDGWVDTLTEYRRQVSRQIEIRRQEIEGLGGGRALSPQPHGHIPGGMYPR